MTDELKPPVVEQEKEDSWIFHVIDNTAVAVLNITEETSILLGRTPLLLGIYIGLLYLHQKKYLMGLKRIEIAEFFHITRMTLQTYLEQLDKIGLISIKPSKFGNRKDIMFNRVRRLPEDQIERLGKVSGFTAQVKVLDDLRSQITTSSFVEIRKEEQVKQDKLFIETQVSEKVKAELEKKAKYKKSQEQKFPIDDYTSVLDGYRKYKGIFIKPHSPDEGRYRKAAKNMFLSGWKVLDILECMKFFSKYCRNEGYEWMNNWTLETVGKKMAEFKAGNLKRPELGDDLPEYTG